MPGRVLAADSKLHLRPIPGKAPFRGLIGVIVQSQNPEDYIERYNDLMDDFFSRNPFDREKQVYKSSEIAALIPGPPYILRGILRRMMRIIFAWPDVEFSICFTILDLKRLRERYLESIPENYREDEAEKLRTEGESGKYIQLYGEPGSEAVVYTSVINFFEMLRQYYPIVCLGSLCEIARIEKDELIVDGCSGPRSHYWDLITTSDNKFSIVPHGDSYNCFISIADIITRWIDEELRQARMPLNMSALITLLREWRGLTSDLDTGHIHIAHLGNKYLGNMKPLAKQSIETFHPLYLRRPIIFIVLEEASREERLRFEHSPSMILVHNRLFDIGGSFLFWDTRRHAGLVREGSIMVIYGENGDTEIGKLTRLGYTFEVWDLRAEGSPS